jgi:hypothetical protein
MHGYSGHTNIQTGNNIDAAALTISGVNHYATHVSHYQFGNGLTDVAYADGQYGYAVGAPNSQCTYMGDDNSYVTLGFC